MFSIFSDKNKSKLIKVFGLVQGVGFRPFIYRLAQKFELSGYVINTNDSVEIKVSGSDDKINLFIEAVKNEAPKNAKIGEIQVLKTKKEKFSDFLILESRDKSSFITEISPDMAVCPDCLDDMKNQDNRIDYPFVNCTNCGPRFSIITALPYDRESTTMKQFVMCIKCKLEYSDVEDRRFHAEPVACNICGPEYTLFENSKKTTGIKKVISKTTGLLDGGRIVAIKGLGGFNLVVDAFNNNSILKLRELKNRAGKPFAIMFKNIEEAKKYAFINEKEEELLLSQMRPIVLLKIKENIAFGISFALDSYGIMLPYLPLHYLLFEKLKTTALIYTSGNLSEEPIEINNDEARKNLKDIYDAILTNNRDIYNRVDDSVTVVVNNIERITRRSRGYAPSPVRLNFDVEGIFAAGSELKNTFCIGKNKNAFLSQHIGDLKEYKNFLFYQEVFERFRKLFKFKPEVVVCDKHPEYLSTKFAKELSSDAIQVQHHYAHIASCMAENNIEDDVIGVAFDGNGFGDDGAVWGGEFFVCNLKEYERVNHFDYCIMPGGDAAIEEPYRMAVSYLYKTYSDNFMDLPLPFLHNINIDELNIVILSIKNKINSINTSSAGRLFDGVSALLNLCLKSSYEAEAPMLLESIADKDVPYYYNFTLEDTIKIEDIISGIVNDIGRGVKQSVVLQNFTTR